MFEKGQQVEVYSGSNVLDRDTQEPFWYPAIVTAGPFPTNTGEDGYYVLGVGEPVYPFDQYCKRAKDMRRPEGHPRVDLAVRYIAFMRWTKGVE